MKILITGGAGFIGSHIVDELIAAGHEALVVDDLDPAAHHGVPAGLNSAATYEWRDVRDATEWPRLLRGVDALHRPSCASLVVAYTLRGSSQ